MQFLWLQGDTFARFAEQVVCNDPRAIVTATEFDIPTCLSSPLWAAVAAVRSLGKACAIMWMVIRAARRVTDLDAISAACTVTIGAAQAYHRTDLYMGTESGMVSAGFDLIVFADGFAGDCRIALMQTLGNLVERCAVFQLLLDDKTVFIG